MPAIHLLGTGAAFSSGGRTTTMLCLRSGTSSLIIDCGGDVVARMQHAGVRVNTIQAVFLTHEHIDHVGGFPLLYKKLWLSGRRRPLPVYGLPAALIQVARCFATYDTRAFEGLPPIEWHAINPDSKDAVYTDADWEVHAASGCHSVPVFGLRIRSRHSGGTVTYSSDTSPEDRIARLASGSDLLFHEATGAHPGHCTALQAAEIAQRADVRRLVLVHLPDLLPEPDLEAARQVFTPIDVGEELQVYTF